MSKSVALICTTYNCKDELEGALSTFTSPRNLELLKEIVIVDGGSNDGTWELLERWARKVSKLKVYQVPGANIPRGRNEAIRRTDADIIVFFDSGTKYNDDWLELMLNPFDEESISVVGGLTILCCGESLFERCMASFADEQRAAIQPSHRGIAFYRKVWDQVGGYPEHVEAGEDTWFNTQWMKLGCKYINVPEAKNFWTVRRTWRSVFKMQRRNTKGHIILGEEFGTTLMLLIASVYVFLAVCLVVGFYDHHIWFFGIVIYVIYLARRLFGKGRWRVFFNPIKLAVGFFALTGSDLGTALGAIEGSALFLRQWITSRKRWGL